MNYRPKRKRVRIRRLASFVARSLLFLVRVNHRLGNFTIKLLDALRPSTIEEIEAIFEDLKPVEQRAAITALNKIQREQAQEFLITILREKDGDEYTRKLAVAVLSEIGNTNVIMNLISSINDKNANVRNAIVDALVKIGSPALSDLIDSLSHSGKDNRDTIVHILGRIGDPIAINPLSNLLREGSLEEKKSTTWALGEIGGTQAIPHLVSALRDKEYIVRVSAAEALVKIGSSVLPSITQLLKSIDKDSREFAVKILDELNWQPEPNEIGARYWIEKLEWDKCAEIGKPAIHPLVSFLKRKKKYRDPIVDALVKIGQPSVQSLISLLRESDNDIIEFAAWALGRIADERSIPYLVTSLQIENVDSRMIIQALSNIGARGIDSLATCLMDVSPAVRNNIIEMLNTIQWKPGRDENGVTYWITKGDIDKCVATGKAAVPSLINALRKGNPGIRTASAKALGRIGDSDAVPDLIDALNSVDEAISLATISALGEIGDNKAVQPLINKLNHSGSQVYKPITAALVKIGLAASDILTLNLKTSNEAIRVTIIQILDEIGWEPEPNDIGAIYWISKRKWDQCLLVGKPAIEPLVIALESNDESVRESAFITLTKIGEPDTFPILVSSLEKSYVKVNSATALAVAKSLKDLKLETCQLVVKELDAIGWLPNQDENGAAYWIAKGDIDKCITIGKPAVFPLTSALQTGTSEIRAACAYALGQIGDSNAVADLIGILDDLDTNLTSAAILALGEIGDKKAVQPLINKLRHSGSQVYEPITTAFVKIGLPAAKPLTDLLGKKDIHLRRIAANILIKIGFPAISHVSELLRGQNSLAREEAQFIFSEFIINHSFSPDALKALEMLDDITSIYKVVRKTQSTTIMQAGVIKIVREIGNQLGLAESVDWLDWKTLDIFNPNNINILFLLFLTIERCRFYKKLVMDFLDKYCFVLGESTSVFLRTFFVTTIIEKRLFHQESDIWRLLHLYWPENPSYSPEALLFNDKLSNRQGQAERYFMLVEEFNFLVDKINKMISDFSRYGESEDISLSAKYLNAREALENTRLQIEYVKADIDYLENMLAATRKEVNRWLINNQKELSRIDNYENLLGSLTQTKKTQWGKTNHILIERCAGLLIGLGFAYEASAFCAAIKYKFDNLNLSREIIIRSHAEFLRLVYKKTIKKFDDVPERKLFISGPAFIGLSNKIEICEVSYLILGPVVDQVNLEPNTTTQIKVESGIYTIICEPKDLKFNPLIWEDECLPGRYYSIGVTLTSDQPPPNQRFNIGSGISIGSGLFGIVDIDPWAPLYLLYLGKKYLVQDYLGEGSGGIVYKVVEEQSGKVSAIKFMTSDRLGENTQIEIGRREWQAYQSLTSKQNVSPIKSFSENIRFEQQGMNLRKKKEAGAYEMEFAANGNLRSWATSRLQEFSLKEVIEIVRDVINGVKSLHISGYIHRDLRPENILVFDKNPKYQVCDFTLIDRKHETIFESIANVIESLDKNTALMLFDPKQDKSLNIMRNLVRASTFFAAPEEHFGFGRPDSRSDIYSIGGILYWLLTGFDPFELLLRESNRDLYDRFKMAMDQDFLHVDFRRRKELFGDLQSLDSDLRKANLMIKQGYEMEIGYEEIICSGLNQRSFMALREFFKRTIHPNPEKRYSSVLEMEDAISTLQDMAFHAGND